ncbi:hypothetical protein [Streptomyces sp. NPDC021224]|uniref:hypothetical protein n=1 Tax=unclassified Streptomyces TaxID=2593676 RepID=UPI00379DEBF8
MDPLTAVTAGRAAAGRRFAFYLAMQLTSVLVPGLVAVTCSGLLLLRARHPDHLGRSVESAARTLHGPAVILVDVTWLAAAYVLGYVGRELAFRLLSAAELALPRRRASTGALRAELEAVYGAAALRRCLDAHPLLGHLLNTAGRAVTPAESMRRPGGALRAGNAYEAFNYAKSWLRTHSPQLAPDANEAEINVLLSTLLPLALGTWTVVALVPLGLPLATAIVLAAAAAAALTFAQVLRLRRIECWEALRNLLEDHEMRLAAARLPAAADPALPAQAARPDPEAAAGTDGGAAQGGGAA